VLETELIRSFSFADDTYNLLTKEIENTPQIQIAKKEIEATEANLRLQKAMRIPDLTIGIAYEREGNLRPENVGLYFNIPLPVFNRNQGEIGVAVAEHNQTQFLYQAQEKEMLNELFATYIKANETLKFYQGLDKELEGDFEKLIDGIISSFERKTISMLEFIDYYETYKETTLQLQNIEKETILSIEAINFLLGQNYFRILN
jgi:cobalt-zinc-cadmium efflux system outer membrane protein